jgi:hypothetical protein
MNVSEFPFCSSPIALPYDALFADIFRCSCRLPDANKKDRQWGRYPHESRVTGPTLS